MRNVLSSKAMSTDSLARRKRIMGAILWSIQGVLALLFLFAGSMKLILPISVWQAQMTISLPGLLLRFIGVTEVAGALGLILPLLLRIKPFLTPLAACGLVLEMLGATVISAIGSGIFAALMPLVVGILAAFVAYGRRPSRRLS